MENHQQLRKQPWTPKALAIRTGVSVPTLHFYEKKGLISAYRTTGNQRRYPRDMARRIAFIQAAQKVGISLADIKATLAQLPDDRTPNAEDWQHISSIWKDYLNQRIKQLESIRDKLDSCIKCGCLSLEKCQIYNQNDCSATESVNYNTLID